MFVQLPLICVGPQEVITAEEACGTLEAGGAGWHRGSAVSAQRSRNWAVASAARPAQASPTLASVMAEKTAAQWRAGIKQTYTECL